MAFTLDLTTSHKQFEYLTVELQFQWKNPPVLAYKFEEPGQGGIVTVDISVLGAQGWELVTILETTAVTQGRIGIFKREIVK